MKTHVIYETRGRANEYCELAANLYRGCGHGCKYCYAPAAIKMKFDNFCNPCVRTDILKKFQRDAEYLRNIHEKRPILLSFTTDPYQPLDVKERLTRAAIQILHKNGLKVSILTKGGKRSERDFDLLSKNPKLSEYGVTLVFTDATLQKEIEPNAAMTEERIHTLKKAHDLGIYTYVSLEPVYDPEQSIDLINQTYEFVDFYKVGKLNHFKDYQNTINWSQFKRDVIEKLRQCKKNYYIKTDLNKF
jgi:DNA repair photolyase